MRLSGPSERRGLGFVDQSRPRDTDVVCWRRVVRGSGELVAKRRVQGNAVHVVGLRVHPGPREDPVVFDGSQVVCVGKVGVSEGGPGSKEELGLRRS